MTSVKYISTWVESILEQLTVFDISSNHLQVDAAAQAVKHSDIHASQDAQATKAGNNSKQDSWQQAILCQMSFACSAWSMSASMHKQQTIVNLLGFICTCKLQLAC